MLLFFQVKVHSIERTMGVIKNTDLANKGYTLFDPMNTGTTYLIDNYGRIVHTWESPYIPNLSVYLLENGNLVRSIDSEDDNYGIEIMNWEGDLIWRYFYTETMYYQHHDIEPLPNRNILMVVRDIRVSSELEDAGRDPASISTARIWLEKIVEIKPIGIDDALVVWEWEVYHHLIQNFDPAKNNYGVVQDHPELVDVNYTPDMLREWLHANSVDYNSELDQVLISVRNLDELWIIDHSTTTIEAAGHTGGSSGKGGDILYRWGNPETYGALNNNDRKFYRQHDARWIDDGLSGGGNIMVFNNGEERPEGEYSTVDEIIVPIDINGNYTMPLQDNSYLPVEQTWNYTADPPINMYSQHISGAHRITNGNTMICEGYNSNFYEIQSISNKDLTSNLDPTCCFSHYF